MIKIFKSDSRDRKTLLWKNPAFFGLQSVLYLFLIRIFCFHKNKMIEKSQKKLT